MPTKLISEQQFRDAAKTGAAPTDAHLRKAFIAEVKAADADRTMDFTISTADVDRMGDTIAVDGWKLANYRKNPVVLWAHDSSMMPVAKASNIRVEDGKLKARAEFMPLEISVFSDRVYRAIKSGFLSATSVGFAPMKYAFSEEDGRTFGIDFLEQELLEFSVVPVPANPEALIEARAAGIDIEPFREWALKLFSDDKLAVVSQDTWAAVLALPEKFRGIADSMKAVKGAPGNFRRCANVVESIIKPDAPPQSVTEEHTDPAPTPNHLEMYRRRLDLHKRKIA